LMTGGRVAWNVVTSVNDGEALNMGEDAHLEHDLRYDRAGLVAKAVGSFDHRGAGALWAGVEPKEPLAALAAKLERACQAVGLEPERRAFHPHITLARWKGHRTRALADFLDRRRGLVSEPFEVGEFILFESRLSRHGAHYEAVASYPLA